MEMTSERRIPLNREAVWQALNDPQTLSACIPGCDSIEQVSNTDYQLVITAAIGPVKAKFKGRMLLKDLDPPNSYAISFEGQGGAAGFGKGEARVALDPDGEATILKYTAKAQVGGKLAQVGSRLVDATAKKMADDFFEAFTARVAPEAAPAAVPARRAFGPLAWAVVVLVLLVILYFVFGRG